MVIADILELNSRNNSRPENPEIINLNLTDAFFYLQEGLCQTK